ncbi:fumarylacetoacetate hydrolase family protein, partial [Ectopseudomonas hydrolytica]|uniref:fumarylacetoacetate hydrolase family protein n=1 Tax=Ectopseudomonas hydrolytica TaxID=2493633 RepID=UPI003C30CC5D
LSVRLPRIELNRLVSREGLEPQAFIEQHTLQCDSWKDGKVHRPLVSHINDALFGQPNAGVDMTFNFPTLVAHAAKTRPLGAGTIIGSGTVSNYDRSAGSSCLAEKRTLEIVEQGEAKTPFLKFGDRVRIEMFDVAGQSIFGAIDQVVEKYE